jgi:hypothetical protein
LAVNSLYSELPTVNSAYYHLLLKNIYVQICYAPEAIYPTV